MLANHDHSVILLSLRRCQNISKISCQYCQWWAPERITYGNTRNSSKRRIPWLFWKQGRCPQLGPAVQLTLNFSSRRCGESGLHEKIDTELTIWSHLEYLLEDWRGWWWPRAWRNFKNNHSVALTLALFSILECCLESLNEKLNSIHRTTGT